MGRLLDHCLALVGRSQTTCRLRSHLRLVGVFVAYGFVSLARLCQPQLLLAHPDA